uniref:Uncharacterized protein n=1 Tax=Plectus sambesii TaxID=2011161 RepID=A0A914UXY4_9BILA
MRALQCGLRATAVEANLSAAVPPRHSNRSSGASGFPNISSLLPRRLAFPTLTPSITSRAPTSSSLRRGAAAISSLLPPSSGLPHTHAFNHLTRPHLFFTQTWGGDREFCSLNASILLTRGGRGGYLPPKEVS